MMGERRVDQAALFYTFSLEDHVPSNHLLRSIDRFVELEGLRAHLAPFSSAMGRPSVDPELLIRMLLVGYCFGIRSERRLCEEVHLNLAYRRAFRADHPDAPPDDTYRYRASKLDCDACALKPNCCPNGPARKVTRSIHEDARDVARDIARTDAYVTSRRERKKVEMLFAHLKRILRLDRLRLRGPCGARDEFLLAATAQNLRKMARLIQLQTAPVSA